MGSIPHWGAEIPHATEQLSPHTAVTEACGSGTQAPQLESLCTAMKDPVCCVLRPDTAKEINKYTFKNFIVLDPIMFMINNTELSLRHIFKMMYTT